MINWDKAPAEEKIAIAKTILLSEEPFFGLLLLYYKFVACKENDPRNPMNTLAVSSTHIFYSEKYINSKPKPVVNAGLFHEILHAALLHLTRFTLGYDHDKWNQAADYIVNAIIMANKKVDQRGERIFTIDSDWLYDAKYDGYHVEKLYRELLADKSGQNSGGKGKGKGGQGTFDYHCTGDQDAERDLLDRMAGIKQILEARGMDMGSVPGEIVELLDNWAKPKVQWRKFIRPTIQDIFRTDDYSKNRLDHRYNSALLDEFGEEVYAPTLEGEKNKTLVFCCDTSGSVSTEDLKVFISEIAGPVEMCEKLLFIACDAQIQNWEWLDNIEDIHRKVKFGGRGGTSFIPPFKEIAKQRVKPELMIYLTDGFGDFPSRKPPYKVIFGRTKCHADKAEFPSWSTVIDLEY